MVNHQRNVRKCREAICEIHEDSCQTFHQLFHMAGVSNGICQEILMENFSTHHIAAKLVSFLSPGTHNQKCLDVCLKFGEMANSGQTFIFRIITQDEVWIYDYNLETKQQPSQWKCCNHQDQGRCSRSGMQQKHAHYFIPCQKNLLIQALGEF